MTWEVCGGAGVGYGGFVDAGFGWEKDRYWDLSIGMLGLEWELGVRKMCDKICTLSM